ncbi:ATP-binding protein [Hyphobacterium sp. SN044]|uniref:ATP-binding protein n=1 Tax=Hyphobacterium sp. SN044 TaxID=2912575 RepID=UPI001F3F1DCE|nr:ATP-binding protein [Hyphobacterium sp. SN044]MCF8878255.1 ATP-binding protein [Hyphobacterium sp. SN044]
MGAGQTILPRWQADQISERLRDRRVLLLAGARQCGKTTLARQMRSDAAEYITLDDPGAREAARADPLGFVRRRARTLIIDEIQRVPDLLPAIKLTVDEDMRPGQFLLTGSANLAAIPQANESLAGRIAKIRLRPLSAGEQAQAGRRFLERAFEGDFARTPTAVTRDEIVRRALAGGYPEAIGLNASARRRWHQDYIGALLERDLKDITRVHRLDAMRKLVGITAAWSSKLMNIADIGAGLSIRRPTVEAYLGALEALFLVDRVPAWTRGDYERVGRKDKLFMADSGLMASILNWRSEESALNADRIGKLIETFVYNQIAPLTELSDEYRLYHYRDRLKREIDFLVERESDGAILAVEVKAALSVKGEDFRHIRWFAETMTDGRPFTGIVLYAGNEVFSFGDGMTAVPISALWAD